LGGGLVVVVFCTCGVRIKEIKEKVALADERFGIRIDMLVVEVSTYKS
jgi:hypothetical protein